MKKVSPKPLFKFVDVALGAGATAAKIIPSDWVVIDERVRFKCKVPRCAGYGQYLTCPPYVMSVEAFSRIRSNYKWGLLVQVEAKNIDSTEKSKRRIDKAILKQNNELHRPFKLKLLEIKASGSGLGYCDLVSSLRKLAIFIKTKMER